MTDKRGVKNPDYNCQNAVDDKYQVLTAVKVTNVCNDDGELSPMKEKSRKITGRSHKNTIGDCGYSDKEKYKDMEKDKEIEYYVPDRTMYSSKKNRYSKWSFRYEPERDVYICPEGKDLVFVGQHKDVKGLEYRLYRGVNCKIAKFEIIA